MSDTSFSHINMVCDLIRNYLSETVSVTESRNVPDTTGEQSSETSTKENEFSCFQDIRETTIGPGISPEAADLILSSWRMSTRKQYGMYVKQWLSFCSKEKVYKFR